MLNVSSEDDILKIIHKYFPDKEQENLILGKGDDCSILKLNTNNSHVVITTDIFAENVHFRRKDFPAQALGYKSLAVNISDIYSMGAMPESMQLALTLPKDIDALYLEEIFEGMSKLAKEHNISLSGGDLTKGDLLSFSITLLGTVDKNVKLYRNKGSIGDTVFLVGKIGLSRLALTILEGQCEQDIKNFQQALKAHLYPTMYRESSLQIANFVKKYQEFPFSLMDVSDGLARDFSRLSEKYGVDLCIKEKDLHKEIISFCENENLNPLEFALQGGEDYALVGTCPAEYWDDFNKFCPLAKKIGILKEEKSLSCFGKALNIKGYDHFGD